MRPATILQGNGMTVCQSPGYVKRFRRTPWKFQRTFRTPLRDLNRFVAAIVSAIEPSQTATVVIDGVIMPPRHLPALFASESAPLFPHESAITTTGATNAAKLLHAALADWTDFIFVTTPKSFVIYADHDERLTVFGHTRSNVNRVATPLSNRGFETVDYHRNL
jgi:hypothetical protein